MGWDGLRARRSLFAALIAGAMLVGAAESWAAGGAFAVDDAAVDEPGACKVETWGSFADNTDRIGVIAPACVVNLLRPIEIGVSLARLRSDRAWTTEGVIKGKTNLLPVVTGRLGAALVGGAVFDLTAGEHTHVFFALPLTYSFNDQFRINLNAGWLWEREQRQSFFTWGAGIEWAFANPVTFIAEVFGLAGHGDDDPRFQAGLRFTPRDWFDIDLIYGRNITGEDANWITVGLNIRFDVLK